MLASAMSLPWFFTQTRKRPHDASRDSLPTDFFELVSNNSAKTIKQIDRLSA
jgi:hypothetical protein